jgi:hypothetical protein
MNATISGKTIKMRTPAKAETCERCTGDDLADDLIQVTPQRVPARTVFRQRSAINEFNREGITLGSIGLGMYRDLYEQRVRIDRVASDKCVDPEAAEDSCPLLKSRMDAEPTPEHLVQPGDEARAEFLRNTPLALVCSVEHQDAVARWHYAALHGDQKVRGQAAGLLKLAVARRRGRQQKHSTDPDALAQAYFDFVEYLKALRGCLDEVKSKAELLTFFPDCNAVFEVLGTNADEQLDRSMKHIAPANGAITILGKMVGLKSAQLHDILKLYRAR